ncbi:uncharacterized protein LOC125657099 [Ostrea edulis]|uniref:uncharacterized protein LOC125657099 n=1 Tax=Ostrea edulis TaxID=37623 RepID=UPI0024AF0E30|nr:uncharacterized protein LOC125657099 [Ostrea edulis]
MNELRVRNLLLDRYNTKFFTLVHKFTRPFTGTPCYSNNLACHPAVGDMRSVLRLKIQNAINSAILAESEDRGIFVGGRRRNRKKKRTKHVKSEKKKAKRPEGGKELPGTRNKNKVVRESSLEEDTKPLIESGFCDSIVSFEDVLGLDLEEEEDIPPLVETDITFGPLVQYTYAVPNIIDYIEQIESTNMPFFKKKQPQETVEQLQEKSNGQLVNTETEQDKTPTEKPQESNPEETKEPETQPKNENEAGDKCDVPSETPEIMQEETDGGTSISPTEDGKATQVNDETKPETTPENTGEDQKPIVVEDGVTTTYQNDVDGVIIEAEQKTTAVTLEQPNGQQNSKESSPLITKDSDVTCLCCTIL